MDIAIAYLLALILFLVVDLLWIKLVVRPMFEQSVGRFLLEEPRFGIAALFYAMYIAGVVYFAVLPGIAADSWLVAAVHGALLGLIAYGTYDSTNLATLKGWTSGMLAVDVLGGAALSAFAATVGFFAYTMI